MPRLTYANVVSTLALFLVLSGGAAYGAHRYLTRKSVGAPQLKSNAVTTAKIKANAVTTRKIKRIAVSGDKIKEDAVSTEKLADNAVDAEKIDLEKVPFGRVVARMRTNGSLPIGEAAALYPMTGSSYTQAANELDSFVGQLEVTIPVKCMGTRTIQANVVVDAKKPTEPPEEDIVATGFFEDNTGGALSATIPLEPPAKAPRFLFEPGVATSHQASLAINADCTGGGGMTASSAAIVVLGTR